MARVKLIRITTVPISFRVLLKGQLRFMKENGFEVTAVSSPGDELTAVAAEEGVPVKSVPMTRTISPFKDLQALWQLYRFLKKEKPDIVHTHTPKAGILGMLAARLARVPVRMHTVAGLPLLETTGIKRKILNRVEKITCSCATRIYPNSKGLYEIILQNRFAPEKKLNIIGNGSSNGIDTAEFDPEKIPAKTRQALRKATGINSSDFVFLFVGRIVTDKGINELISAFKMVSEAIPEARLVLVGNYEDDLDPLHEATGEAIRTHPKIHAAGYQNRVIPYFAMADCLVFPSYREGFPNVVMQAAAMQLNAIVTDINGCNEIIENGKNGWLVPVKNTAALKEKMTWCIRNKKESDAMGLNSREKMKTGFERSFVQRELLREYRELLAGTGIKKEYV